MARNSTPPAGAVSAAARRWAKKKKGRRDKRAKGKMAAWRWRRAAWRPLCPPRLRQHHRSHTCCALPHLLASKHSTLAASTSRVWFAAAATGAYATGAFAAPLGTRRLPLPRAGRVLRPRLQALAKRVQLAPVAGNALAGGTSSGGALYVTRAGGRTLRPSLFKRLRNAQTAGEGRRKEGGEACRSTAREGGRKRKTLAPCLSMCDSLLAQLP